MAPKADSAEGIVLNFVNEQNKPLNSEIVADCLQKFNLKKTAVQKALDNLADSGKITFKEYGKHKIYLARQDQFDIPNSDELAQMKEQNAKLQELLSEQKKEISVVEAEIKGLQSNLTLEEICNRQIMLRKEVLEMEVKLAKLKCGVTLVSPEERKTVEAMYTYMINQWRRRKRMFRDVWDAITENSLKDVKEFKKELGIEYDEDVSVSLQSYDGLPGAELRLDNTGTEALIPFGLPGAESVEPPIDPFLKPVDFIESLSEMYRKIEKSLDSDKSFVYLEQYCLLCGLGDAKLLRRCLQAARQYAVDVHLKVVLSAWLRYERREDELVGASALDCVGIVLECPKASLVNGFETCSGFDSCKCSVDDGFDILDDYSEEFISAEGNVCFCVGDGEVYCTRGKIAALSRPLNVMLYSGFVESERERIDFSHVGISLDGLKVVRFFSLYGMLGSFSPDIVLEVLSFANRFCCDELKSSCDKYLASLVSDIDEALVLIDYALEERAHVLVASCLQVLLRELPGCSCNKVMNVFCCFEGRERLASVGHASFALYYFLSEVALEDNIASKVSVMLLERLRECATESWQKMLASHRLGCVLFARREYEVAQYCFEAAAEAGHVYSMAGVTRCKFKLSQQVRAKAYDLIDSLILTYKPAGWMYQERSLYDLGDKKIQDLNDATKLDPTLSFPYKYRAVAKLQESDIKGAIAEINRIARFRVSSDCLELRAWFLIAIQDYEAAMRDVRALLTLDPNYMMFDGKMRCDDLIEQRVRKWSQADCLMHLYDRWSSLDDIGLLAVSHQMLLHDPGKSTLLFRQSLFLFRLDCRKAAMQSLRLARNHSSKDYERLVYEGWILYETGHREEALSKAEESIVKNLRPQFSRLLLLGGTVLGVYL